MTPLQQNTPHPHHNEKTPLGGQKTLSGKTPFRSSTLHHQKGKTLVSGQDRHLLLQEIWQIYPQEQILQYLLQIFNLEIFHKISNYFT